MNAITGFEKPGQALGLAGNANVRTPCGPKHLANLRPGALVVTRDGGLQPVRLVWTRVVTEAEMAADPALAPICLRARAVGPMMPQRDLIVAGDHRLLVPGYRLADRPDGSAALIPAREIAGTSDAAFVDRAQAPMTFWNIVFDAPQVFTANGLPVESFPVSAATLASVPPGPRARLIELFPDLARREAPPTPAGYATASRESYLPEYA